MELLEKKMMGGPGKDDSNGRAFDKKAVVQALRKFQENGSPPEVKPFAIKGNVLDKISLDRNRISHFTEQLLGEKEKGGRDNEILDNWMEKSEAVKRTVKGVNNRNKGDISGKGQNEFARKENREETIDFRLRFIKDNLPLICVGSKNLYAFTGKVYEDISDRRQAIACFKVVLAEKTNRLFRDYMEIYNQLLSDADISVSSIEQLPTNRDVIVFQNGTYNVRKKRFYENMFWREDYIFSILATDYDETDFSGKGIIDKFLNTFCAGIKNRITLYCEIVGYCFSNYENKKALFYFLGAPDAGKSTVCRFLEMVLGENLYMACAIKELNAKYTTGELFGVKVCADEDVATNKPLKSEDIALIKKITSSDKIRVRQIYKSAMQMRPECKLVWAGNGMITFATSEDLQPLINRMIIFPLEVSIPKEDRDPDILSKLAVGKNYMITLALHALHNLVENKFCFTEVVNTEDYFYPALHLNGVEEFVEAECVIESDAITYTGSLYSKYRTFCERNKGYQVLSMNQFVPYLKAKYGIQGHSDGSRRGLQGIRLLDIEENS